MFVYFVAYITKHIYAPFLGCQINIHRKLRAKKQNLIDYLFNRERSDIYPAQLFSRKQLNIF